MPSVPLSVAVACRATITSSDLRAQVSSIDRPALIAHGLRDIAPEGGGCHCGCAQHAPLVRGPISSWGWSAAEISGDPGPFHTLVFGYYTAILRYRAEQPRADTPAPFRPKQLAT